MGNLSISTFNIVFFQKPSKPPSDEVFSDMLLLVLRYFPIPGQISIPFITAKRKEGGEIAINPAFIQFLEFSTKDFMKDIEMVKEITQNYFTKFETKEVNQFAIRLTSTIKADYVGNIRQLLKGEEFKISASNTDVLSPHQDVKLGIRLVFRRGEKRYDLKVEPYFNKIDFNYVDFNMFDSKLNVLPADVFKLVDDETLFFTNDIAQLLSQGEGHET